jgi:predicted nucleotide-binding protein
MAQLEVIHIMNLAGLDLPPHWTFLVKEERQQFLSTLLYLTPDDVLGELVELVATVGPGALVESPSAPQHSLPPRSADATGSIFVVHGHASAIRHETVRVLERGTDRDVIVLHEQANGGRTILEKFEDHASGAAYAVVLLTGDDQGGIRTDDRTQPRGRQNVIFELGFFFGKLGRRRVAVLLEAGVEKPSDIDGLVYISLDEHGAWKQALAKELEGADISVDRSRMP